jgi:hypothetical protein
MTPEEAKALGLDEVARRRLIRIDDAKLNIAPAHEARWLRLIGVDLGNATLLYPNGDNVQTVEPWTPPNLFADIRVKVINQILDEIDAGPSGGPIQRCQERRRPPGRLVRGCKTLPR